MPKNYQFNSLDHSTLHLLPLNALQLFVQCFYLQHYNHIWHEGVLNPKAIKSCIKKTLLDVYMH